MDIKKLKIKYYFNIFLIKNILKKYYTSQAKYLVITKSIP
jgi:hypothetical protein